MALEVPRQSESAGVVAMQTRAQPRRNETRHTFSDFFFFFSKATPICVNSRSPTVQLVYPAMDGGNFVWIPLQSPGTNFPGATQPC